MQVVAAVPTGALLRTMETDAEIEGNGQMNYACGGTCKRILLHHMNEGSIFALFGPSKVTAVLRCPECGSLNLVPKASAK